MKTTFKNMKDFKTILFIWENNIENETFTKQDVLDINIYIPIDENTIDYIFESKEFINSKIDKTSIIGVYVIEDELLQR